MSGEGDALPGIYSSVSYCSAALTIQRVTATMTTQAGRARFFIMYAKTYNMKKLSIIVAMLIAIGVSISSCSAGAHVGTKHHGVSAGAQAH
jgi:hypothetical protein